FEALLFRGADFRYTGTGTSGPCQANDAPLGHGLNRVRHQSYKAGAPLVAQRGIHNSVVSRRTDRVGEEISRLIALSRIRIEKFGPRVRVAHVDKIADEAGEHLCVINGRVEVRNIRQLALHVEQYLGHRGVKLERRIPRPSIWAV